MRVMSSGRGSIADGGCGVGDAVGFGSDGGLASLVVE